jgi:hypothetical protein
MKPNGIYYKCAFTWNELNDTQRKKVIQKFEEDYGDDFVEKAQYGNEYCAPLVKAGKKLSSKRKFGKDDLGYYCNEYLSYIFQIRTMHECVLHAEIVKKETNDKDMTLFCTGIIAPNGEEMIEQSFFTKKEADNAVEEFNNIVGEKAKSIGLIKQVIKKTYKAGELTYWKLYEWNYDTEAYELSKDYPIFLSKKLAIDRASHDLRMNAALYIQWEVWKDVGYKPPESYDFTQANIFKFTKENLLKFDKCLSQSRHLKKTKYANKVFSNEVDDEFIAWCEKEL